jgi:hypothetical protein
MEDVMHGEGQAKLALCGCGKLHFTYGPVTLHFDRDEFQRFAESVGRLGAIVKRSTHGVAHESRLSPSANICH